MEIVKKIISMLENGQHKEAINEYNEVLKSGTSDEKFLLGEEMLQYGFLEEAIALFENLLLYYPGEGEIIVLLAEIVAPSVNIDWQEIVPSLKIVASLIMYGIASPLSWS